MVATETHTCGHTYWPSHFTHSTAFYTSIKTFFFFTITRIPVSDKWNNRDQIYLPVWNNQNNYKLINYFRGRQNTWNTSFLNTGSLYIRQEHWSLREKKQRSWALTLALLAPLSFPATVQGGETEAEHDRPLDLRRQSWETKKTKPTRVQKTENQENRKPGDFRGCSSSTVPMSECMREN